LFRRHEMISRELFEQLADAVFEFNQWAIENDKTYNASMKVDKWDLLLYLHNGTDMDYYVESGDRPWNKTTNVESALNFIEILKSKQQA